MVRAKFMLGLALVLVASRATAQTASDTIEATSLLGKPLARPRLSERVRADYQAKLDSAARAYARAYGADGTGGTGAERDPDLIIWLGRRTAYLGRFREAIGIFSRGIALHPTDARFYRHRGHRYLTIRRIDDAIRDLERADQLTRNQPDQVELDGLPNARGIPTSTLQSNIRYHLGLAYYLKGDFVRAADLFRRDVAAAVNPDMVVASSHWLYMALRRAGRVNEAERVLAAITPDMEVIENQSYHRLLLMYKGALSANDVAPKDRDDAVQDATVLYGIANWHWYHGRKASARKMFEQIMVLPQWGAFGFLAAEAELGRMRR